MACNCKVNQQIDYLHKKYGNEIPVSKKTRISFMTKEFFRHIGVYLIQLILIPFFVLHLLYKAIFSKNKIVNLNRIIGSKA